MGAFVACQCQEDYPLAFVSQERSNTVLTHVRGYGYRVDVQFVEECAGIHGRGISNVTTFGIGNDELVGIVFLDIFHSLFKSDPAFHAHALIESEVRFVGNAKVSRCVDDGFIEGEDRIFFFQQVFRDFLDVCIQTYAE